MQNNRNLIECCNNTQQGAPRTGKQMCTCALDLGDASHITCDKNMSAFDAKKISLWQAPVWLYVVYVG